MSRQIVSQKSQYVSLPTYLEQKGLIKGPLATAARELLYGYDEESVKILVKAISSNHEYVTMDLAKGREVEREEITQTMYNRIKFSKNYDNYMKDYTSIQVTTAQLASIYAHIMSEKFFRFEFDSNTEKRVYVYEKETIVETELLPKVQAKLEGTSCSVQILTTPVHYLLECMVKRHKIDEALRKGVQFTNSYENLTMDEIARRLISCSWDVSENHTSNLSPFVESGNVLKLYMAGVELNFKVTNTVCHRGLDRLGVCTPKSLSNIILLTLGLKASITNRDMSEHFIEFLRNPKKNTYSYFGTSFIEDVFKRNDDEELGSLKKVRVLVLPGSKTFVCMMTDTINPAMDSFTVFNSFKQTYLKVNMLYSIINNYRPVSYLRYLKQFCLKMGVLKMLTPLVQAFRLYDIKVIGKVDVGQKIGKLSKRLQGELEKVLSLMGAMERFSADTDELKNFDLDNFVFTEDPIEKEKPKYSFMGRGLIGVNAMNINFVMDQQEREKIEKEKQDRIKKEEAKKVSTEKKVETPVVKEIQSEQKNQVEGDNQKEKAEGDQSIVESKGSIQIVDRNVKQGDGHSNWSNQPPVKDNRGDHDNKNYPLDSHGNVNKYKKEVSNIHISNAKVGNKTKQKKKFNDNFSYDNQGGFESDYYEDDQDYNDKEGYSEDPYGGLTPEEQQENISQMMAALFDGED